MNTMIKLFACLSILAVLAGCAGYSVTGTPDPEGTTGDTRPAAEQGMPESDAESEGDGTMGGETFGN